MFIGGFFDSVQEKRVVSPSPHIRTAITPDSHYQMRCSYSSYCHLIGRSDMILWFPSGPDGSRDTDDISRSSRGLPSAFAAKPMTICKR